MSQQLIIEDSDVIDTNNSIYINNYLFYLLQSKDQFDSFCDACVEILNNFVEVKTMIVFQKPLWDTKEFKVLYSKTIDEKQEYKLDLISEIIKQESSFNNCYSCQTLFSNKEENKYRKNLYILPLIFKQDCLAYLSVEIKANRYSEVNISEQINLVSKYMTLYIYNQTLEEKQKQLKKEEERLKENQQNQSQYLSHMNHELRTPIAAVIGFAKMLQQKLYGDLNPKQAQYIDAIYQSGTYLLDLINDFLDISKIQAEKEELFIEKILVNELCESSLALVKTKAEEGNIALNLEINADIDYCFVDQRRIKQILVNLLSNAVKFTEEGSVTLSVTQENNHLLFKVIDTGIGIDKQSQEKLFKPFSQIHNHLQNKYRSSGLGLVISRELARLHGGDITLESEKNKGSCFTLSLPNHPS